MNRSKISRNNENDPDKQLSEAYGNILENRQESSEINDPLYKALLNARDADQNEKRDIPVRGKESSWDAIIDTIGDNDSASQNDNKATIIPIRSRKTWLKAAAAIILIAFSSLLLIQQFSEPGPVQMAEAGSTVQTVELADGSTVTLRPNSSLYKLPADEGRRAYALSGEALFDVVSLPDKPFSVEAGSGRVIVTGTRFNIAERNQTAKVFLLEGSVRFETKDGAESVSLEPGQASEIDQDMQLRQPFTFEADLITSWTQNRLTFRDRQAGSIFDELEYHFGIQINAPESVENESLGGTIQLDSAEQSLSDLGTVLGGSFVQTDDNVYEFRQDAN
ncbi:FecR family protein [Rhodohalobacter sp. 8-1]|uniref:FecR family protein n=1 Tax=Rhodohalobacter sp. 8-1 TaxID=3131972 RepID=UPI0030ED820E